MKPPLVFNTLLEHGAEVPNNEGILFSLKDEVFHEKDTYKVTVKASRKALLDYGGTKIYSVAQLFKDNKEIWHEIYPSQLRESQGEKIIEHIKSDPTPYIK